VERRGVRGGATVTEATHGPSEDGAGGSETGARAAATHAFDDAEDLLRQVPFFRTLTHLDLARLIGALEDVSFAAGTRIFAEGADGDALYLLKRGRVAITVAAAEGERTIATLEAPAHFGDVGLLLARRTASAAAIVPAEGLSMPTARFSSVLLPAPFGPTRPTTRPAGTSMVQSASAQRRPYLLPRPWARMMTVMGLKPGRPTRRRASHRRPRPDPTTV